MGISTGHVPSSWACHSCRSDPFRLVFLLGLFLCHCLGTAGAGEAPVKIVPIPDFTGHTSIGIVADPEDKGKAAFSFALLKTWEFSPQPPVLPPPPSIQEWNGKTVELTGFMFPLQDGDAVTAFLLMSSTQTCCFGPRPSFNQFLLAETAQPVPFVRFKPVTVKGTFFIEPRPDDGYIYRIEARDVVPIPDPVISRPLASSLTVPLLPWPDLTQLANQAGEKSLDQIAPPASWSERVGQQVLCRGNLVGPETDRQQGVLTIGAFAWDGCCTGAPPDPFNSLKVIVASGSTIPAPWEKSGEVKGLLTLNPPSRRTTDGFFTLSEAEFLSLAATYDDPWFQGASPTPLIVTYAQDGDVPGVKLLLRGGISVESQDPNGNTPLHQAANFGHAEVVRALLAAKSSVDARNQDHRTPLHLAAAAGWLDCLDLLAASQADLNAQDNYGFTPLSWSLAMGKTQTPLRLIELGARTDLPNKAGFSPLHLAVRYDLPEVVQVLASAGVSLELRTTSGQTSLDLSAKEGNSSMTALLRRLGATR